MTGTIQGCLLDKLLKTRYPLTYYLIRQQEFVKAFPTTETNGLSTSFESDISMLLKRKASLVTFYNLSDTKVPHEFEFVDAPNEFGSDQSYHTIHDQSSETDENDTQEYDARPLLKNVKAKRRVQRK